jgi:hypothetical protein
MTAILARQEEAEILSEETSAIVGKAGWAGAWIDYVDGGTVHIAVKGRAAVQRLNVGKLPNWVKIDTVDRSLEDLLRTEEQLRTSIGQQIRTQVQSVPPQERGAFIRENRLDADGLWRTKIDIPSNQVVVVLENGTVQAEVAAAALSGPKALPEAAGGKAARLEFFDTEELARRPTPMAPCQQATSNDCVPLRGAIETNDECTLGFAITLADGGPGILSAGHCDLGVWHHNDVRIGFTAFSVVNRLLGVDAAAIRIQDNALWKVKPMVRRWGKTAVINGETYTDSLPITRQINTPGDALIGALVCHGGLGMERHMNWIWPTCGRVTEIFVHDGDWKDSARDLYGAAEMLACKGDSGGAVYSRDTQRAYGIVEGGELPVGGSCTAATNPVTYFSWINKVEDSLDVEVMFAP